MTKQKVWLGVCRQLAAFGMLVLAAAVCRAEQQQSPNSITITLTPNACVGATFPQSMQGFFGVGVTLAPQQGWQIVTNQQSSSVVEKSGQTLWYRLSATGEQHNWLGVGFMDQSWPGVLFTGLLAKGPGPGTPPTFDAAVADVDIDVDVLGVHQDEHWTPTGNMWEDMLEAVEGGGMTLPASIWPKENNPNQEDFPDTLPEDCDYKILRLTVRPHWRWGASGTGGGGSGGQGGGSGGSSGGAIAEVVFSIQGDGVALYRVSDNSRLAGPQGAQSISISPTGVQDEVITEDLAIVTNEDFTGPVLIQATLVWDSRYLGGNNQSMVDLVRLVPEGYMPYPTPTDYPNPSYVPDPPQEVVLYLEAQRIRGQTFLDPPARTTGSGWPDNPRVLLTGFEEDGTTSVILRAYSDPNYTVQINENALWSVQGPQGHNGCFENGQITIEGKSVRFSTSTPGEYVFTCQAGEKTEQIKILCAKARILQHPEYFFARSEGVMPLKFSLEGEGIRTRRFYIPRSPWCDSREVRFILKKRGKENPSELSDLSIGYGSYPWDWYLGTVGPSWTATAYDMASEYVGIANTNYLWDWREKDEVGCWVLVLKILVTACVEIDGGFTNYVTLESPPADPPEIWGYDNRYEVCPLGKAGEYEFNIVLSEKSGYEHLTSLGGVLGYTFPTQCGSYVPDGEGHFVGDQRHTHPAHPHQSFDTKDHLVIGLARDWVPGFSDHERDVAVAGCFEPFFNKKTKMGPWFVCYLYDFGGTGWENNDPWEEFVAKTNGGGIGIAIAIGYSVKSSGMFKNYWDLETTQKPVKVWALTRGKVLARLRAENVAPNPTAIALATVGFIATAITPYIPPQIKLTTLQKASVVVGLLISGASAIDAFRPFFGYNQRTAIAATKIAYGIIRSPKNNNSQPTRLAELPSPPFFDNTDDKWHSRFLADGIWGDSHLNTHVRPQVGDSLRLAVEVHLSAQNMSHWWLGKRVYALLTFASTDFDISKVKIEWWE